MQTINLDKTHAAMALDGTLTEITSKKQFEIGEVIGVKEPIYATSPSDYVYACDNDRPKGYKLVPSYMTPRAAIRTFLRVTGIDGACYYVERAEKIVDEPKRKTRRATLEERLTALERRVKELEG